MFTRQELIDRALQWHDNGVMTLPLLYREKIALVKWKVWAGKIPPKPLTEQWFRTRWQCNMGVMLGEVGIDGRLIVLDFDDVAAYVAWRHKHRAESLSYTVKTSRGWHVYLWMDDAPTKTLKMPGGEVKASGYVVGEGSVHKSGWIYLSVCGHGILSVSNLESVGIDAQMPCPSPEQHEIEITPTSTDIVGGVVSRIKDAISITGYLSRWTDLVPKGDGTYMGVCPFHKDTNPSLRVWPKERRCYCYSPGCRAHRRCDVITCAEFALNVSTQEAIRILAHELG